MGDPDRMHLEAIAALVDPRRRALYDHVSRSAAPVSRDAAAAAAGLPRSTAAFHLDRLVDDGLLEVEFQRTTGRTGPGSGRPAKLYRRASAEHSVSVPAREYELAGELLATAVEAADRSGLPVRTVLADVAAEAGRAIGERSAPFLAALEACGYEPRPDGADGYDLVNCPFHRLARSHTDLICAANVELLRGVALGSGDEDHTVEFSPQAAHCCVHIGTRRASDTPSKNSHPTSRQSAAD